MIHIDCDSPAGLDKPDVRAYDEYRWTMSRHTLLNVRVPFPSC